MAERMALSTSNIILNITGFQRLNYHDPNDLNEHNDM